MSSTGKRFSAAQRIVHWFMAVMIVAMLFIGIGMVSTLKPQYWTLVSIHKPLGAAIFLLVILRLGLRLWKGAPPLPLDLPRWQAAAARASHLMLYGLMFAMPLVGWSMLSAGGYPVVLWGPMRLPPIAPHNDQLHAVLRSAHTWLALLLFATILMHVAAALFHALARKDDVFESMT